jgi:hypothetical protein
MHLKQELWTSAHPIQLLQVINQANGLYPPYDTSASYPPWSLAPFTVAREQVSHAVPMQYPHITFPQISDFEQSHVFR